MATMPEKLTTKAVSSQAAGPIRPSSEQALAPALRSSSTATVLTDGFSCHMQVRQLTDNPGPTASAHLAQILDPQQGDSAR